MRKTTFILAITYMLALLGCQENSHATDVKAQSADKQPLPIKQAQAMEISCYFPDWASNTNGVPFDKLDQIYFAFLRPTPDAGFEPLRNPKLLQELVDESHKHGVKVSIAVGGARPQIAPAFEKITADEKLRATFIQNLLGFITEYNLDGIDIDWEYPIAGQSDQNCALLMHELAQELKPRGKLLSIAVQGDSKHTSYPPSMFPDIDYLNVMSYDRGKPDHSTIEYAEACIEYWTERGCPAKKIMLGVPFYSRSSTAEPVSYSDLRSQGAEADEDLFTDQDGNTHGYNGRQTLLEKVQLAKKENIGGIMIWQIKQDSNGDDSLLLALHTAIADNADAEPTTAQ